MLSQVLPTPRHFEQASQLVTPDMLPMPCGSDPEPFVAAIQSYVEAGFDEVYINQKAGSILGAVNVRVKGDLERFKSFIEDRGQETGGWRGEVEASPQHGDPGKDKL